MISHVVEMQELEGEGTQNLPPSHATSPPSLRLQSIDDWTLGPFTRPEVL